MVHLFHAVNMSMVWLQARGMQVLPQVHQVPCWSCDALLNSSTVHYSGGRRKTEVICKAAYAQQLCFIRPAARCC